MIQGRPCRCLRVSPLAKTFFVITMSKRVYYCLECDFSEEQRSSTVRVCTHGSFLKPKQWGKPIPNEFFEAPPEGGDNRPDWCPLP